jgi:hypothetical protein
MLARTTVAAMPVPPAEPAVAAEPDVERLDLGDGAWVDVVRGFLESPGALFDVLTAELDWQQGRIFRYERWDDEPRLGAYRRLDQPAPHQVLIDATRWLTHRYRHRYEGYALAWYRDGRDGQAFHRDRDLRWLDDTIIAVLTVGARRPWLLRPRPRRRRPRPGAGAR